MNPAPGVTLDERYRLDEEVGQGTLATVFRATDLRMERPVVVKVPRAVFLAEPGFVGRLRKEIRRLNALATPRVLKVFDEGMVGELPYFVTEFLAAGNLVRRLADGTDERTPARVTRWLAQMAKTLDAVHRQGVVHRDVNPRNVLFDSEGHAYLDDTGVARCLDPTETGLTATGLVPGAPEYLAPEVLVGEPPGAAGDQYALATTVFEALVGSLPFERGGEAPLPYLLRKSQAQAPDLADAVPGTPRKVAAVVRRGLAADPAERFESCKHFAWAFKEAIPRRRAR